MPGATEGERKNCATEGERGSRLAPVRVDEPVIGTVTADMIPNERTKC